MTERRALTPEERKTLTELPGPHAPFHLLWDTAMGSVGATGCLGAIAVLALVAILGTYHVRPAVTTAVIATVAVLVVIVSAVSTATRYSIARRKELDAKAKIDADLAGGEAEVERHRATAALRAILEEHRERAYFMRLEDGRAMFIGFWNPSEHDNPAGIQDLPPDLASYPAAEFEIARGPQTRAILGVSFRGEPLSPAGTIEFRQGMGRPQLTVGETVPIPWDDISRTYG